MVWGPQRSISPGPQVTLRPETPRSHAQRQERQAEARPLEKDLAISSAGATRHEFVVSCAVPAEAFAIPGAAEPGTVFFPSGRGREERLEVSLRQTLLSRAGVTVTDFGKRP